MLRGPSPILFLFYIRDLFYTLNESHPDVTSPSYIDDIALVVQGNSVVENRRKLEETVKTAFEWAEANSVAFDESKTEFIHFHKKRSNEGHSNAGLTLPNGRVINPITEVRWLGFWFDRKLDFKEHVERRVIAAKRVTHAVCRLATSEWGLSAPVFRQLYLTCIATVSDFGAVLWWKGQPSFLDNSNGSRIQLFGKC